MNDRAWGFETQQIHAGAAPDPTTGARATPIYQTTSYVFRDTQHAANLFALAEPGNIYTRIMNPTTGVLEERVAALEGGVAGLATASGQAAETLTFLTLASVGDHIVSSNSLYGGTYNLLHHTLPKLGIEVSFVDADDLDGWRAAIRPTTRAFFAESIGNPRNDVLDIESVAAIGREQGVPLIIDNTVPTPYLVRPLDWGAAIVVHSATKFIGGHGTSIGGVIVDGGNFDFGASGRHPGFTEPDASYHGLKIWEALGPGAFAAKARISGLRDIGMALSPFNAFLLIQGLETLSLRMERHVSNAVAVAQFLEARDEVTWVDYAGLPSSPWYAAAQKYAPKGAGSIVTFGIQGGPPAGRSFIEGLELHSHLANIGDVRSLAIHPASTTHSQMGEEELLAAGVRPETVRLSVGLELIDDILADLDAGFRAAKGS